MFQVAWRRVSKDYPLTVGLTTFDPKEDMSVSFKQITEYQTHWDLVIKRVEMKHKGMYECQISATVVHTHHVYLNVLPIKVTGTEFVNIFSKINLTCNATGAVVAPHDIDWFFEGRVISTEYKKWRNRIQILKYTPEVPGKSLISNLIIDISSSEDSGRYVCRSSDVHAVAFNKPKLIPF
ncbi:hypothetical protein KUTeg_017515 [Tegillarca granosa]|uniref:Ig-like domain-containing protein n=1 Tax=Tegillarca granosa TaxID=220873 RepID=A0ABQ9EJ14_TEGGR|nr:hypothetical protein KUTeg_017515 [Tegillarca granosa]